MTTFLPCPLVYTPVCIMISLHLFLHKNSKGKNRTPGMFQPEQSGHHLNNSITITHSQSVTLQFISFISYRIIHPNSGRQRGPLQIFLFFFLYQKPVEASIKSTVCEKSGGERKSHIRSFIAFSIMHRLRRHGVRRQEFLFCKEASCSIRLKKT